MDGPLKYSGWCHVVIIHAGYNYVIFRLFLRKMLNRWSLSSVRYSGEKNFRCVCKVHWAGSLTKSIINYVIRLHIGKASYIISYYNEDERNTRFVGLDQLISHEAFCCNNDFPYFFQYISTLFAWQESDLCKADNSNNQANIQILSCLGIMNSGILHPIRQSVFCSISWRRRLNLH